MTDYSDADSATQITVEQEGACLRVSLNTCVFGAMTALTVYVPRERGEELVESMIDQAYVSAALAAEAVKQFIQENPLKGSNEF